MLFRLCFFVFILSVGFSHAQIHVSPTGKAEGDGSAAAPFGSLDQARDRIRTMKAAGPLPAGPVTVWIHGGLYEVKSTFKLEPQDSGTEANPVIYRAVE